MKKQTRPKRLAALLSAAAMSIYTAAPASAAIQNEQLLNSCEDDEFIRVIVQLYGEPLLSHTDNAQGVDYLESSDARCLAEQMKNKRISVFDDILRICPDAELDFTYDSVFNGFACTIPAGLADDVEAFRDVENVIISEKKMVPTMNNACETTNIYQIQEDDSGYTGEGQVIAVIDTELNTAHEMFAPMSDDVKVKITKRDVEHVAKELGLNRDIDPDKAYRSNKVPFAAAYSDSAPDIYTVENDDSTFYHGTHVSGIAAGNRVTGDTEYENDVKLQGVAPDAQLLFFSCADYSMVDDMMGPAIDDAAAMAAIEDSVKLGADVINLSFGSSGQAPKNTEMYREVIEYTDNAGVLVCAAVGNDGEMFVPPENVDACLVGAPSSTKGAFSIAAGYSSNYLDCFVKCGDSKIKYIEFSAKSISDKIDYVDCTGLSADEMRKLGVKGKLAMYYISPEDNPDSIISDIIDAGAEGAILYSDTEPEMLFVDYYESIYLLGISAEDAEILLNAKEKTLDFSDLVYEPANSAGTAPFSSIGIPQSLELKPEITGIGMQMFSASYNGFEEMSGTSMASPFIAGCAALTNQYLTANSLNRRGEARTRLIKNVLMDSAVPLEADKGILQSPRRQGAGLVNMAAVCNDNVLMLGTDGKAAVELGDNIGDKFSFDITLENLSENDVTFDKSELALTTNSAIYDDYFGRDVPGNIPASLNEEHSFSDDLLTIPAQSEKTVTVTVDLDAKQCREIEETFKYGWFIEGFLSLKGSENCCDISVPIVGFHGDWLGVPIFGQDDLTANAQDHFSMSNYLSSFIAGYNIPTSASIAELVRNELALTEDDDFEKYEQKKYEATHHEYVISPNYDFLFDDFSYMVTPYRDAYIYEMKIYDEEGNLLEPNSTMPMDALSAWTSSVFAMNNSIFDEGTYKAVITARIYADGADERPQSIEFSFNVDTTAPKLDDVKITEEDGRKILTITASDERLEGVYIIGNGYGGLKGSENNGGVPLTAINDVLHNLDPVHAAMETEDEGEPGEDGGFGKYSKHTASIKLDEYVSGKDCGDEYANSYDFLDVIPCEQDENNSFTFSYDITDLTDYSITVTDRGYNMITYYQDKPTVAAIPSTCTRAVGEQIMPDFTPEIIYDGEITDQGWEICDFYSGEWRDLDETETAEFETNGTQIRYRVSTESDTIFTNAMTIRIKDMYKVDMEVLADGEFLFSSRLAPQFMDLTFITDEPAALTINLTSEGYVPRTIEFATDDEDKSFDIYLYQMGDVNGDGKIDVTDLSKTAAHIKGIKELEDYPAKVADVTEDGAVNVTDISKMAAKVKGIKDF